MKIGWRLRLNLIGTVRLFLPLAFMRKRSEKDSANPGWCALLAFMQP